MELTEEQTLIIRSALDSLPQRIKDDPTKQIFATWEGIEEQLSTNSSLIVYGSVGDNTDWTMRVMNINEGE